MKSKKLLTWREARLKYGKQKTMMSGGKPMSVIRPKNADLALELAKKAHQTNDGDLLDRLPFEVNEYTFVGWMAATPGYVVDRDGEIIDVLKSGDSFMGFECDQFEPGEPFVMHEDESKN